MKAHTHLFTGTHPEVLADGTPAAIGALVTPNPDDPHDAAIIEKGWLVPFVLGSGDDGPTLKDLQDEAGDLGVAKSGTKADLVERIAAHKGLTTEKEQS